MLYGATVVAEEEDQRVLGQPLALERSEHPERAADRVLTSFEDIKKGLTPN